MIQTEAKLVSSVILILQLLQSKKEIITVLTAYIMSEEIENCFQHFSKFWIFGENNPTKLVQSILGHFVKIDFWQFWMIFFFKPHSNDTGRAVVVAQKTKKPNYNLCFWDS